MKRLTAFVGILAVQCAGCGDPHVIVVVPPGVKLPKMAPPNAATTGEAIGEAPVPGKAKEGVVSTLVSEPTKPGAPTKTASGLSYVTLREGTGPQAKPGDTAKVTYVGRLVDGSEFDASSRHGGSLELLVGGGQMIQGWQEGISGMKVGEKRQLTIPPLLGYGSKKNGIIPADSTLIFDVELLEIRK